jgi:lactobin A/cerein 7B family class IIb bacteriocin
MRELNVNEIKEINGGFVFLVPGAVKVAAWAAGIVAGAVAGHYAKEYVKNL